MSDASEEPNGMIQSSDATDAATAPENDEQVGSPLAPVSAGERYEAVDVLRGFAVLGILVMNIYAFAMPFAAYTNPLLWGGEGIHMATWIFTHLFFDQKFMAIFAMLFGAGLMLMHDRAVARGKTVIWVYMRRMFWLLIIGVLHGYLLWFGDILANYALCGFVILMLRKLRPRTLIIIGIIFLIIPSLLTLGMGAHFKEQKVIVEEAEALLEAGETLTEEQQQAVDEWTEMKPLMFPDRAEVERKIAVQRGSYTDIVAERAPMVFAMQTFMWAFFGVWRMSGMMLLGMAFLKMGILYASRDDRLYWTWIAMGYGLGLPIVGFGINELFAREFDPFFMWDGGIFFNYFGSIFVGLAHVALVMLLIKRGFFSGLRRRLASVGRMALTNYLTHSVILTTVFNGYGLGLYGHIDRLYLMGFVVAVFALQLYYSPIWLRHYRFGPAEWLWRSATYWKLQPMRR